MCYAKNSRPSRFLPASMSPTEIDAHAGKYENGENAH